MVNYFLILANIIDSCNYQCRYCYNVKPYSNKKLNLEQFKIFILRLYRTINQQQIILNIEGGEPTLHPQLIQFCKDIASITSKIQIHVYTNLSQEVNYYNELLSKTNADIVATWHLNQHSLFFVNKLKNLSYYKQRLKISIMYEDIDTKQSICIYNQLLSLNFNTSLNYICDTAAYYTRYSSDEKHFYQQLAYKNIDCNLMFNYKRYNFKYYLCSASKYSLYVHNDGLLYYCPSYFYEQKNNIGNILNTYKISTRDIVCLCNHCSDYIDMPKRKIFKDT